MTAARVTLFIDAQNLYKGARDAFGTRDAKGRIIEPFTFGQVHPIELGNLICSRPPRGQTRTLHQVRVYTGRPDSSKQPIGYGANLAQCSAWTAKGIHVVYRTLRYPLDWPTSKAQEKGIDVALAIDFVTGAIDEAYDVGIICSTDSDLRPAVEYVYRKFGGHPRAEVMAWKDAYRLSVPGYNVWCHFLDQTDFDSISDPTDYRAPYRSAPHSS
jgi:uncharacterized LabA/DUF88 family protein